MWRAVQEQAQGFAICPWRTGSIGNRAYGEEFCDGRASSGYCQTSGIFAHSFLLYNVLLDGTPDSHQALQDSTAYLLTSAMQTEFCDGRASSGYCQTSGIFAHSFLLYGSRHREVFVFQPFMDAVHDSAPYTQMKIGVYECLAIANNGVYNRPTLYSRVLDHEGNVLLDGTPDSHQALQDSALLSS